MAGISHEEAREIAEEAASKALSTFFTYFDVDLTDPNNLKAFREDLEYLRNQRIGTEELKSKVKSSIYTIMGTAAAGGLYWVWTIFKGGFIEWFSKL